MAPLHRRMAAALSCGMLLALIAAPLAAAASREVPVAPRTVAEDNASLVMVLDSSGSTAEDDGSGTTRIESARRRLPHGGGDRRGEGRSGGRRAAVRERDGERGTERDGGQDTGRDGEGTRKEAGAARDGSGSGGAGWSGPAVAVAAGTVTGPAIAPAVVYTRLRGRTAAHAGAAKGAGGTENGTTEGGAW